MHIKKIFLLTLITCSVWANPGDSVRETFDPLTPVPALRALRVEDWKSLCASMWEFIPYIKDGKEDDFVQDVIAEITAAHNAGVERAQDAEGPHNPSQLSAKILTDILGTIQLDPSIEEFLTPHYVLAQENFEEIFSKKSAEQIATYLKELMNKDMYKTDDLHNAIQKKFISYALKSDRKEEELNQIRSEVFPELDEHFLEQAKKDQEFPKEISKKTQIEHMMNYKIKQIAENINEKKIDRLKPEEFYSLLELYNNSENFLLSTQVVKAILEKLNIMGEHDTELRFDPRAARDKYASIRQAEEAKQRFLSTMARRGSLDPSTLKIFTKYDFILFLRTYLESIGSEEKSLKALHPEVLEKALPLLNKIGDDSTYIKFINTNLPSFTKELVSTLGPDVDLTPLSKQEDFPDIQKAAKDREAELGLEKRRLEGQKNRDFPKNQRTRDKW